VKRFWNWVKNEGSGERTLYFDGVIAAESWFDDDITPEVFRSELMSGKGDVTIWLNSPGGDCIAASQIYAMLMDYKGNVTVKIDGIAASAASVIAMAGTKVLMAPTSLMMLHNPSTVAWGDVSEMEKAIGMLEAVKESIINAYEVRSGQSRAFLSELMDEESWLFAQQAIEYGFADGMLEDEKRGKPIVSDIFSRRAVTNSFMEKVKAKTKIKPPAPKPEEPPKPEPQTTVESLSERLHLISGGIQNV
jgi:ATP-dependent Clp protease protease subunit